MQKSYSTLKMKTTVHSCNASLLARWLDEDTNEEQTSSEDHG